VAEWLKLSRFTGVNDPAKAGEVGDRRRNPERSRRSPVVLRPEILLTISEFLTGEVAEWLKLSRFTGVNDPAKAGEWETVGEILSVVEGAPL
jgi:hypothetical protein